MQNVFNLTNKYIVLATHLILYSLISSIYLAAAAHSSILNILIALCIFALMTCAFTAGWFNMIKNAVLYPDREDTTSLLKEFSAGVGEYILPSLGMFFIVILLSLCFGIISMIIGMKLIGNPGISTDALTKAAESAEALKAFMASLTPQQYIKIYQWNLMILCSMSLNYLLILLYLPAMFFKDKNPFKAFLISLQDLFSTQFIKTLGIYALIIVVNFFISIFTALFANIFAIHFMITLLNFYFVTLVSVGIFYYYYHNFVKPQIGQNIDTRI